MCFFFTMIRILNESVVLVSSPWLLFSSLFPLGATQNSIWVLMSSRTLGTAWLITLHLCTKRNQCCVCCVVAQGVSWRPRRIATQSGYHKRRLHHRSTAPSQSKRKLPQTLAPCGCFKSGAYITHMNAHTHTHIHTPRRCISGSGCCLVLLSLEHQCSFFLFFLFLW